MSARSPFHRWPFFIVTIILLLFYCAPSSVSFVSSTLSYIMYPVLVVQRAVTEPIRHWHIRRHERAALEKLIVAYRQEREALVAENIALRGTQIHQEDIQEMHDFRQRYEDLHAPIVQVIFKEFSPEQHFFFIDAGSHRGIEVDMIAVYKNGIIGRVSEVYPWYSKVTLVTDRLCKIPALCVTSKALGIYSGLNDTQQGELSFVSHLMPLMTGELLVSSGDGLIYPKGFGIGRIRSCEPDASGFMHKIDIEPLFDIRSITYCCVIRKGTAYKNFDQELDASHQEAPRHIDKKESHEKSSE